MPIVRIVRMTFREEEIENFRNFFEGRRDRIRNFPGCRHLELWQDEKERNIFFTYSLWENETMLDHYRFSEFFKDTWSQTKSKFSARAEAWTLRKMGA